MIFLLLCDLQHNAQHDIHSVYFLYCTIWNHSVHSVIPWSFMHRTTWNNCAGLYTLNVWFFLHTLRNVKHHCALCLCVILNTLRNVTHAVLILCDLCADVYPVNEWYFMRNMKHCTLYILLMSGLPLLISDILHITWSEMTGYMYKHSVNLIYTLQKIKQNLFSSAGVSKGSQKVWGDKFMVRKLQSRNLCCTDTTDLLKWSVKCHPHLLTAVCTCFKELDGFFRLPSSG